MHNFTVHLVKHDMLHMCGGATRKYGERKQACTPDHVEKERVMHTIKVVDVTPAEAKRKTTELEASKTVTKESKKWL